jgi:hypothetical protein
MTKTAIRDAARAAKRQLAQPTLDNWSHQCHAASLNVVQAEVIPGARVARGVCQGVGAQHSWIVVGNPYDPEAPIIDPTLWSYLEEVEGIWTGTLETGLHRPHGMGSIWTWGRPEHHGGETVELKPRKPFSAEALDFLRLLGPLDRDGWAVLAHAPVEDWPAGEILLAINDTVGPLVPIDIIGMATDTNPNGLYLPGGEQEV